MITIIDENGQERDYLADRNEKIKEALAPVLQEFLAEKAEMAALKKPVKLGYRFTKQIHLELSKYGRLSAEAVTSLDYDTLYDFWIKYLDLIAFYNRYFEIVDTKQLFMVFAGIDSRIYSQLQKHEDDDIKSLMRVIEDGFIGMGFISSSSGEASDAATKTRLGAKEVGHNMVSTKDDMIVSAISGETKTPQELMREIERITGTETKRIKGGK